MNEQQRHIAYLEQWATPGFAGISQEIIYVRDNESVPKGTRHNSKVIELGKIDSKVANSKEWKKAIHRLTEHQLTKLLHKLMGEA